MRQSLHKIVGRYALFDEIASGGMATVHLGRLIGAAGFSRTVAIKRLHPQFAKDPDFVDMFMDEARLAARIRHPNVVPTLDVVQTEDELFLIMEYVQGESLSQLARRARRAGRRLDRPMVVAILTDVLHGLHAAHNARGEKGEPLNIVHRDVSPHNVLVGVDGVSRVFDFGVAKAVGRLQTTREGQIKGKLAYMAPEQLRGQRVGPATDVYSAGVVLWEMITGRRLFDAEFEAALLKQVLDGVQQSPRAVEPSVPDVLDAIVMRALDEDPDARFESAREMALALEKTGLAASSTEVAEWIEQQASDTLQQRAARIAEIESQSDLDAPSSGEALPATAEREQATTTAVTLVEAGAQRPPGRPRWAWGLFALGALLVGGVVAALVFRGAGPQSDGDVRAASPMSGAPDERGPARAPSSGQAGADDTGEPVPEASTGAPADSAEPSLTAEPSGAAPPRPGPPRPGPPRPRPAIVAPPETATPTPSTSPPVDPCANPFYVDATGIKRIKDACR